MNERFRFGIRVSTAALILALLCANPPAGLSAVDARAKNDKPASAAVSGQRVFTCGHSFHVFVYRLLAEMAKGAGITDHQSAGLSSIGGSRVIQHWDVPDEKNEAKAALRAGKVDVLTLSPIWLPDAGIENFVKLGYEHNPNLRVLVQEFWLPNDTYEPIYPLDTRKKVNHNETDLAVLREKQAHYFKDLGDCVGGINKKLGHEVGFVVPVGQAALVLREKIAAGQAPGLAMQWDIFRDPWGHPQPPLAVLSGYCHYAMIYHRSPVGLPVPQELAKYRRFTSDVGLRKAGWRPAAEELATTKSLTHDELEKLNRLLQELAWAAVTKYQPDALKAGAPEK